MYIKYLKLKNFRNYDELKLNFSKEKNIIYGDNAVGKTNILESIYILSTAKSHKLAKDKNIIKFGKEESHIQAEINNHIIDINLHKNKNKGIAINKIKINKISQFFGISNVIFFSPEDLNIIKDGPAIRRKFLDFEICQINKLYISNIINYNKIMEERNVLLKEITLNNKKKLYDTLDVWDDYLIKYGKEIIKIRKIFLEDLKNYIEEKHYQISGKKEKLEIYYEQNTSIEEYEKNIKKNRDKDLKYLMTTIGPHRDDIIFKINKNDLKIYGSQGQQRTAALSLKISEIEFIKNKIKDTPILLLDDVFSELDEKRQKNLINSLKGIQTIITTTGIEDNLIKKLNAEKVYNIKNNEAILK
ncbi:MAG: DNA replication/repair protein RecF [Eubacteriales bacterium]|nr:DNA replication/repair protein RecF [Eubacteriales bacterium]